MKTKGREQCNPTLGFADLDVAKAAVLASLDSAGSRRCYEHAIAEFIDWYRSEPRLGFNKVVVTRYRMHLESRGLASGTINLRLAAIRRLAYGAADSGLLSPEQAAGIRRVKGATKLGVRVGNWLGHVSVQTTEKYLGCKQRIRNAVNDRIGIEPPA